MTFKQALALNANVRKGEHGSLVVYADKITRTETDSETGEEAERAIPFMKGYTVLTSEQIDGLPAHYYAQPAPRTETVRAHRAGRSLLCRDRRRTSCMAAAGLATCPRTTTCTCRCIDFFRDSESYYATLRA